MHTLFSWWASLKAICRSTFTLSSGRPPRTTANKSCRFQQNTIRSPPGANLAPNMGSFTYKWRTAHGLTINRKWYKLQPFKVAPDQYVNHAWQWQPATWLLVHPQQWVQFDNQTNRIRFYRPCALPSQSSTFNSAVAHLAVDQLAQPIYTVQFLKEVTFQVSVCREPTKIPTQHSSVPKNHR